MHRTLFHTTTTNTSLLVTDNHALKVLPGLVHQGNYTSATIITDAKVEKLHGKKVKAMLQGGLPVRMIVLPPGERSKDLKYVQKVLAQLVRKKVDRHDLLIALGGGVVGDLTGFVASIYLRGIDYIQMPTSLMAQVDSAIGGKTGVDFCGIKNVVGTFAQPKAIICDTALLHTLPHAELVNGMAEVIKYGFIGSKAFSKRLQGLSFPQMPWDDIVRFCARTKARVVIQDRFDRKGKRALLNFGHTVGHALESLSNFSLPHGKAIAIGMVAAARLSRQVSGLSQQECEKVESLIARYGLPTRLPPRMDINKVINVLQHDKKAKSGKVGWVLLEKIGKARAGCHVPERLVRQVLSSLV